MSSFRIVRLNVYWFTCLVFSGSAFFLSMFGKQVIRDRRDRLVTLSKGTRGQRFTNESFHGYAVSGAMDSIFRLFQVALVLLLVAHIDAIVISVGPNIFAPIVIFGLFYVFGFIGPSLVF